MGQMGQDTGMSKRHELSTGILNIKYLKGARLAVFWAIEPAVIQYNRDTLFCYS